MVYPKLVNPMLCTTPIKVIIHSEEINKYGEPTKYVLENLKCNWQSSSKTVYTDEKKMVQLTAKAYFDGDICPDVAEISGGSVEVFGKKRTISRGFKCRNLDGSVNYTLLEIL